MRLWATILSYAEESALSKVESTKSAKAATKRSFILGSLASLSRPRVKGADSEWEFIYLMSHPPLKEDGNISYSCMDHPELKSHISIHRGLYLFCRMNSELYIFIFSAILNMINIVTALQKFYY